MEGSPKATSTSAESHCVPGSSLFAGAGAAMPSAAVADGDVISAIATVESAEGDVSIEAVMAMP